MLDRAEEGLLVLVFAVMTVVAFVNVITRYVIQYSLAFTEELVVSLFVWMTLLGAAVAFREGSHLAFTWLLERVPRPVRRTALALSSVLSLALFACLVYYGVGQIRTERLMGTTSEALAIPQWWYTAGLPLFGMLAIVRIVQAAWAADRAVR